MKSLESDLAQCRLPLPTSIAHGPIEAIEHASCDERRERTRQHVGSEEETHSGSGLLSRVEHADHVKRARVEIYIYLSASFIDDMRLV